MSASGCYVKSFFLNIFIFYLLSISSINAKCVCKCVNKTMAIICEKDSDVKPICMPFKCHNRLIGDIPKISPPKTANVDKKGCERSEIIDLSSDKVLSREQCQ